VINGGISTIEACHDHLKHVDGVMMGREAYSNPYIMAQVDQAFYGERAKPRTRDEVLADYIKYALENGSRLNHLSKHIVGLYHGEPRSRLWRRHISQNAHVPGSNTDVLRAAYQEMVSI